MHTYVYINSHIHTDIYIYIYTHIPAYIHIYIIIIHNTHTCTHTHGLAWKFQQANTHKRYRHQAKETTEDTNDPVLKARVGTLNLLYTLISSVRRSPTMRPQQDFSKSLCSCCCPPLLSCSFLVPLGLLSHYLSTSLVVFLCFLFPPLVRIALLPVVCFPPSLLHARNKSAFFF